MKVTIEKDILGSCHIVIHNPEVSDKPFYCCTFHYDNIHTDNDSVLKNAQNMARVIAGGGEVEIINVGLVGANLAAFNLQQESTDNKERALKLKILLNGMVDKFATKTTKSKRVHKELQSGVVLDALNYLEEIESN